MKKTTFTVMLAAALASCSTVQKTASLDTLDGEWRIVSVNGEQLDADDYETAPFFGFNVAERRVYGCSGCNRLSGELDAGGPDGRLVFGDKIASTRMMCRNMAAERKVLGAMPSVTSFRPGKKNTVLLTDKSGKTVFELQKTSGK